MTSGDDSNARSVFRLRYPEALRPSIRLNGLQYWVSELSEGGVRILLEDSTGAEFSGEQVGHITFADQQAEVVEGEVLRINTTSADDVEAVLQLTTGVSLKRMLSEQVRIRSEYLRLIDPADGRSNNAD